MSYIAESLASVYNHRRLTPGIEPTVLGSLPGLWTPLTDKRLTYSYIMEIYKKEIAVYYLSDETESCSSSTNGNHHIQATNTKDKSCHLK